MDLLRVTSEGFRCLQDIDFQPEPGINIIRGGNAQGKTSLLEAILFAATSKSHRTSQESDLLRHGAAGFRVQVRARRSDREVVLEATWREAAKRFKVNGVAQTRVSDVLGKIAVVLFSPEDVTLVKGTASHRRRFLDMALSQLDSTYLGALQRYRQALRQRNELLRVLRPDAALLDVWDVQLAQFGSDLVATRAQFLADLAERAAAAYARIAQQESLSIAFAPDVSPQEPLLDVLKKSRDSDVRRRVTLRGPHRDDFVFLVADRAARSYASQGQQKTAALAVKLAELSLAQARSGESPVLMLDEVLSELDAQRASRLFEAIGNGVQCLLTTTNCGRDDVTGTRFPSYRMEQGRLEKA